MFNKQYLILSACIIGSLIGLSQCSYEKDFKSNGVISEVNTHEIKVSTITPDSLRKEVRKCEVINIPEVKCKETVGEFTYTHTINPSDVKNKEELHIGNVVTLKLPVLKQREVSVNKQYVKLSPYETQVGNVVFLTGVIKKDKEIKINGVFKTELSPLQPNNGNVVKVFIPAKYSSQTPYSFYVYRQEGNEVGIYELMNLNIQRDEGGTGYILENDSWMRIDKVMSISSDFSTVYGIEEVTNVSQYLNSGETSIPSYKTKYTTPLVKNVEQQKQPISHESSFSLGYIILFCLLGLLIGMNGESILAFICNGSF
ncbi:MAG: hypothetical protein ACKPFF_11845 [Planktothrix sp.]